MTDQLFSSVRESILQQLDDIQFVGAEEKRSKDREIQTITNTIREVEKKNKSDEIEAKNISKDIERYGQLLAKLKDEMKVAEIEKMKKESLLVAKSLELGENAQLILDLSSEKERKEKKRNDYDAELQKKMKGLVLAPESNEECPICLNSYNASPNTRYSLLCGHEFCKQCLGDVMKNKRKCAICSNVINDGDLRRHF